MVPQQDSSSPFSLTTAKRHQRRGRVDHGTGGHKNDVYIYENYATRYKRYVWLCSRYYIELYYYYFCHSHLARYLVLSHSKCSPNTF